jgi:hypothetical protein
MVEGRGSTRALPPRSGLCPSSGNLFYTHIFSRRDEETSGNRGGHACGNLLPPRGQWNACVPGKNSTSGGETNRKGGNQARQAIGLQLT